MFLISISDLDHMGVSALQVNSEAEEERRIAKMRWTGSGVYTYRL